jgi:Tat protein translocase TatB subunit
VNKKVPETRDFFYFCTYKEISMLNSVLVFLDWSGGEMILIALVALLVLGPEKMGTFARKAGKMMNEVKRVSSDFTSQLNDETGSLKSDLNSVRDTIKDATQNIKNEFNNQSQEIKKHLDPEALKNINEPSNDVYSISNDTAEKESHPEGALENNTSEQTTTQHVTKVRKAKKKPTSNQENNSNP